MGLSDMNHRAMDNKTVGKYMKCTLLKEEKFTLTQLANVTKPNLLSTSLERNNYSYTASINGMLLTHLACDMILMC